jgi:hypothetical protein
VGRPSSIGGSARFLSGALVSAAFVSGRVAPEDLGSSIFLVESFISGTATSKAFISRIFTSSDLVSGRPEAVRTSSAREGGYDWALVYRSKAGYFRGVADAGRSTPKLLATRSGDMTTRSCPASGAVGWWPQSISTC